MICVNKTGMGVNLNVKFSQFNKINENSIHGLKNSYFVQWNFSIHFVNNLTYFKMVLTAT